MLRGQPVPVFLHDGGAYGEVGPALELDGYMIRTAALRSRSLTSILAATSGAHDTVNSLNSLISISEELEADLAAW